METKGQEALGKDKKISSKVTTVGQGRAEVVRLPGVPNFFARGFYWALRYLPWARRKYKVTR